jgi:hypothetical protein
VGDQRNALEKSILGDPDNAIIKSGTLNVTRGAGVIAVGLNAVSAALDAAGTGPWKHLTSDQKLLFVLVTGAIWGLIIAADAIARGLAVIGKNRLVTLPGGVTAKTTKGTDVPGWSVVAADGQGRFLLVKSGHDPQWLSTEEFELT